MVGSLVSGHSKEKKDSLLSDISKGNSSHGYSRHSSMDTYKVSTIDEGEYIS